MKTDIQNSIFELPELRDRKYVFRNRHHAGKVLADMLEAYAGSNALVLGIPSGGVPIASVIAQRLNLELDAAVANKITPSWNSEWGYGAVAFDGTLWMDSGMSEAAGLSEEEIAEGTRRTLEKVARRNRVIRGNRPFPDCRDRTVILVDDGVASGVTLQAALQAIRKAGAGKIIVAVPTGHAGPIGEVAEQVDAVYCPNIRSGYTFAVAEAYEFWSNLDEHIAAAVLQEFQKRYFPAQP